MDAEIKEFGFILIFGLLLGFGFFSISLEDEAFTQPAPQFRAIQQAYAEQESVNILSKYYFDPTLYAAFLVMPTALDFPPEDPLKYFERRYSQGINLELGFIEFDTVQEFLMPNINKLDFLPPITNKFFNDFEILPPAFATSDPPPSPPTAFTAIPVAPYKIDLDWTHDMINVTGYNIYRNSTLIVGTNNATITEFEDVNQLNSTLATVNSFSNAIGLNASTNYSYKICAVNGTAEETTCTTTSATTSDDTDVWNLKEYDGEVPSLTVGGSDIDFTATGGTGDWLSTKSSVLSRGGLSAILWKTFNVSEITGSDIEIYWDLDIGGIAGDTFELNICEDKITAYNETIWKGEVGILCPTIKSVRILGPTGSGTTLEPIFTRFSFDWTQITNEFITIWTGFDDDALNDSFDLDIKNFTWTNATSWDFTGVTINYTNTNDDLGAGADFECNALNPDIVNFSSANQCDSGVFLATSSPHLELKAVEGVNDWQYREYIDLLAQDDAPFLAASIDSSGFKMVSSQAPSNDDPTEVGEMFLFKSFPASSVINKNITVSWDGVVGVESTGLFVQVQVYNGTIDRWSGADFPIKSDLDIERERIDTLSLTETIPFTVINSSDTVANVPSESSVTVVFRYFDTIASRDGTITIQNITVGNTFYDLQTGTIAEEVSGRNGGDRGLVTPSSVTVVVFPDQVTGLVITQDMNNNATLDWNDAANSDNYQVLRKTNFTLAENSNTNGTWQFRQQKNGVGINTNACAITVSSGMTGNVLCNWSDGGATTGSYYIFKTFPRDFLNNTNVQISMSETVGLGSPPHTLKQLRMHTSDEPFFLDRNDESQWLTSGARDWNDFGVNTSGILVKNTPVISLTTQSSATTTVTSGNWAGNSDFASIIWEMNDLNSLAGFPDTRVYWMNITDLTTGNQVAFYNFSGGSRVNEGSDPSCTPNCNRGTIEAGTVIIGEQFEVVGNPIISNFEDSTIPLQGVSTYKVRGSGTNGFGLNSTEVEFGLIQPIANLNTTALNSTAIKLTWDQVSTEHPTDPLTGVIIQRVSPETSVYACTVCSSLGVEVGPIPNKVYGQRITLNQTETIDKIVNQQRWFNGAVTGGFIDVFIAYTNGTVIQSSVEKRSAVTLGQGGQSLADRTYTFSPGVTLVAGTYDFMSRWDGVGFTNAVTGKSAGNPNAGQRVLDANNNFNDGYSPVTIPSEDTTIFLNLTGFSTIVTVDDLDTMYTDTGLAVDTTYTYQIKGQSAVSTGSFGTNNTATTLLGTTVNAPTGFMGLANLTDITLSWNNQTDNDSWTLSRNGSNIATGLTNLTYQDVGVTIGENFGYVLTAINGSATNSTSELVVKSNDVPSIVTGAGVMPINGVSLFVQWDDPVSDDGEGTNSTGLNVSYDIFRRNLTLLTSFINLTTIAEGTGSYNDTAVTGGETYEYKIQSKNEIGFASANSTAVSAMVANALIIQTFESDGTTDLDGSISVRLFNNTFTSTLIGDGQGRVSFPMLNGNYNFTVFHIATDFLINKTTTSITVPFNADVLVSVTADVQRVNCPSNGPSDDFLILVNSTSPDHFISSFTNPVCDAADKVSWDVIFEGFQGAALGGSGGGNGSGITGFTNAGTLGSTGNAFYTESGIASTFVTTTGILGQGVIKNGTSSLDTDGEIIIGTDPTTWNFLHAGNVGNNVTSINFWLKGDVVGAPVYPVIGTGNTDIGSGTGFHLWTQSGTNFKLSIYEDTSDQVVSGATIGSVPPDDASWHMVSFMMDQGNRTGDFAILCIDAVCDTGVDAQTTPFGDLTSGGNTPFANLTIGGGSPFGNSVTQNTFDFDEFTIWQGYQITQSDINTMYNSGSGSSASSIASGSQVVYLSFDAGTEIGGGGGGGGNVTSIFTTQMKTVVLSLGDFGNNAKTFVVNGTILPTAFATPIISSNPIVVSTSTSNVLITFDQLFLQEEDTPPAPAPSPTVPPNPQPGGTPGGGTPAQPLRFFEELFGFSLFAKLHQLSVGQIQDGTIDITWNSPEPITIESIQVGEQFITWIGFPSQPFTIDGSDRISTGKIPYRIMPPSDLCEEVTGQTINCVDRILYEIPVKIFASVEGQPLTANSVIKVNLSLDITLALFTIFIAFAGGIGAIIYRSAIVSKSQKREKKKLKTKSTERKRIESRFAKPRSKLRRRP